MADSGRTTVTVEEYVERRLESASGALVERHYRRGRLEPTPSSTSTTRDVLHTAAPLLRAVAIAMAPALGRLAVRALAPRLRAALPAPALRRSRLPEVRRIVTPLPLVATDGGKPLGD